MGETAPCVTREAALLEMWSKWECTCGYKPLYHSMHCLYLQADSASKVLLSERKICRMIFRNIKKKIVPINLNRNSPEKKLILTSIFKKKAVHILFLLQREAEFY